MLVYLTGAVPSWVSHQDFDLVVRPSRFPSSEATGDVRHTNGRLTQRETLQRMNDVDPVTGDVVAKTARRAGWPRILGCGCFGLLALFVLAGIVDPFGFNRSALPSYQVRTLSNARQIVGALRAYANDHDGKFPDTNPDGSPITSSNQAFRALFPEYLTSEQLFFTRNTEFKSAWTPAKPDDKLDAPGERPGTNTLRPGENHFAYVRGLTDSSNSVLPLVADGFTAPAGGIIADPVYRGSPKQKGGVWGGRIAIVVHVDQSAEKVRLVKDGRVFRVPRRLRGEGKDAKNLFTPDPSDPTWLQPGQGAVDPE